MPSTLPRIVFKDGVCNACLYFAEYNRKMNALGVMLVFSIIAFVVAPLIVISFAIYSFAG